MGKGISDIVANCSYCIVSMFIFIELMRLAQFNAVFLAFSTSYIRQPAKLGIMGDLTPLQPIAVNIHMHIYICYVSMACTNLLLL